LGGLRKRPRWEVLEQGGQEALNKWGNKGETCCLEQTKGTRKRTEIMVGPDTERGIVEVETRVQQRGEKQVDRSGPKIKDEAAPPGGPAMRPELRLQIGSRKGPIGAGVISAKKARGTLNEA